MNGKEAAVSEFNNMPGTDWREMERRAHEMRREARRLRHQERRRYRARERESCCPPPLPYGRSRCLYRSRHGRIFGVCRGIADHFAIPVVWVRLAAIVGCFFTGFWPMIGAYVIAALLIKPEPVIPFQEESDQEFYDSYVNSRVLAVQRLKRTFDNLERRIRRMENIVTARDYDWEQRLNEKT